MTPTRQLKKFSQLSSRALKIDSIFPKVDADQVNITATKTTTNDVYNLTKEVIKVTSISFDSPSNTYSGVDGSTMLSKDRIMYLCTFNTPSAIHPKLDVGFGAKFIYYLDGQGLLSNDVIFGANLMAALIYDQTIDGFVSYTQLPSIPKINTVSAGTAITVTPTVGPTGTDYQISYSGIIPDVNLIIDIQPTGGFTKFKQLIATAGFHPGYWYSFEYQCKHIVPGTNIVNTDVVAPITEVILVQALTASTYDPNTVRSLQFPSDIIHWRHFDDQLINHVDETIFTPQPNDIPEPRIRTTNGGNISFESPVINRTGRIFRRIDTIQRIDFPFDWRSVDYFRAKLKDNGFFLKVTGALSTITNATSYQAGTIFTTGNRYYLLTSTITTSTVSIPDYLNFCIDISIPIGSVGNYNQYLSPGTAVVKLMTVNNIDITIDADLSDFRYVKTFTPVSSEVPGATYIRAYNIDMKDFIPAYSEAVAWEYYPDVVLYNPQSGPLSDISIGRLTSDITICGGMGMEIGDFCRNVISISSLGARANYTTIEESCQFIFTYGCTGPVDVKKFSTGIFLNQSSLADIGCLSTNIAASYLSGFGSVNCGEANNLLFFESSSAVVGSMNNNMTFRSCSGLKVGSFNRNITDSYSIGVVYENNCTDIHLNSVPNTIEGSTYSRSGDVIKNQCANINLYSYGNNIFEDAQNIFANDYRTLVYNCVFTRSSNINFTMPTPTAENIFQSYVFTDSVNCNIIIGSNNLNTDIPKVIIEGCDTINLTNNKNDSGFGTYIKNSGNINITTCTINNNCFSIYGSNDIYLVNIFIDGINVHNTGFFAYSSGTFNGLTATNLKIVDSFNIKLLDNVGAAVNIKNVVIEGCETINFLQKQNLVSCDFRHIDRINIKGDPTTAIACYGLNLRDLDASVIPNIFQLNTLLTSSIDMIGYIDGSNKYFVGTKFSGPGVPVAATYYQLLV